MDERAESGGQRAEGRELFYPNLSTS